MVVGMRGERTVAMMAASGEHDEKWRPCDSHDEEAKVGYGLPFIVKL